MKVRGNIYHKNNSGLDQWSDDPVFGDDIRNLDQASLSDLDKTVASVNRRITEISGKAPFFYRHFQWIGLSAIALFLMALFYFNSGEKTETIAQNNVKMKNVPVAETGLTKTGSDLSLRENVESSNLPLRDSLKPSRTSSKDSTRNRGSITNPEKKNNELKKDPDPVIPEVIKHQPVENSRIFNDEEQKMVWLRVAAVQVLSKLNSADNQTSKTSDKNVTNPNIGGAVVTDQKSNKYSLDDLPSYPNGDPAFISFVTRGLHNRIEIRQKDVVPEVIVMFMVNAKGKVENVSLPGNVPKVMSDAITKVISESTWNPGKKSGKKGSIDVSVSIRFYYY
jgi:hypothetical protein